MTARGRSNAGSDESIVSPKLAEAAVLNGIGKFKKIPPISLQVAFKDDGSAQSFTFSRICAPPRTTLFLFDGPLSSINVFYLVTDAELAVEDLLLGLVVLKHLGIDAKSLLEERRHLLHGADCSQIKSSSTRRGQVITLMIARLNRRSIGNTTYDPLSDDSCQRINCIQIRTEQDSFRTPPYWIPLSLPCLARSMKKLRIKSKLPSRMAFRKKTN